MLCYNLIRLVLYTSSWKPFHCIKTVLERKVYSRRMVHKHSSLWSVEDLSSMRTHQKRIWTKSTLKYLLAQQLGAVFPKTMKTFRVFSLLETTVLINVYEFTRLSSSAGSVAREHFNSCIFYPEKEVSRFMEEHSMNPVYLWNCIKLVIHLIRWNMHP